MSTISKINATLQLKSVGSGTADKILAIETDGTVIGIDASGLDLSGGGGSGGHRFKESPQNSRAGRLYSYLP